MPCNWKWLVLSRTICRRAEWRLNYGRSSLSKANGSINISSRDLGRNLDFTGPAGKPIGRERRRGEERGDFLIRTNCGSFTIAITRAAVARHVENQRAGEKRTATRSCAEKPAEREQRNRQPGRRSN